MGKNFKRVFALCLAVVMMMASSLAVMAAPTSPTDGGKTVTPVITKKTSCAKTAQGTIKVFYKAKNSDKFLVQFKLRNTSWAKASKKTTTKKSILLTNLKKKGGLYDIRVAGVKNSKQGKWTVIHRLMNRTKATATTKNGKITLKLPSTKGATGYQIKYSTKSDFSNAKFVGQKASCKSRTIKGLKKGTTYYVRVTPYAKVKNVYYTGEAYTLRVKVK